MTMKRFTFTLIELLAVIDILGILAALLPLAHSPTANQRIIQIFRSWCLSRETATGSEHHFRRILQEAVGNGRRLNRSRFL